MDNMQMLDKLTELCLKRKIAYFRNPVYADGQFMPFDLICLAPNNAFAITTTNYARMFKDRNEIVTYFNNCGVISNIDTTTIKMVKPYYVTVVNNKILLVRSSKSRGEVFNNVEELLESVLLKTVYYDEEIRTCLSYVLNFFHNNDNDNCSNDAISKRVLSVKNLLMLNKQLRLAIENANNEYEIIELLCRTYHELINSKYNIYGKPYDKMLKILHFLIKIYEDYKIMKCDGCGDLLIPISDKYFKHGMLKNKFTHWQCIRVKQGIINDAGHDNDVYIDECWYCRSIIDGRRCLITVTDDENNIGKLCLTCGAPAYKQRFAMQAGDICPKCGAIKMSESNDNLICNQCSYMIDIKNLNRRKSTLVEGRHITNIAYNREETIVDDRRKSNTIIVEEPLS